MLVIASKFSMKGLKVLWMKLCPRFSTLQFLKNVMKVCMDPSKYATDIGNLHKKEKT